MCRQVYWDVLCTPGASYSKLQCGMIGWIHDVEEPIHDVEESHGKRSVQQCELTEEEIRAPHT